MYVEIWLAPPPPYWHDPDAPGIAHMEQRYLTIVKCMWMELGGKWSAHSLWKQDVKSLFNSLHVNKAEPQPLFRNVHGLTWLVHSTPLSVFPIRLFWLSCRFAVDHNTKFYMARRERWIWAKRDCHRVVQLWSHMFNCFKCATSEICIFIFSSKQLKSIKFCEEEV